MLCVYGPLPVRPMGGETVMRARMAPVHGCVPRAGRPCTYPPYSLLLPHTIKTAPLLFNSPPPPQLISFVVPVSPSSQFDIHPRLNLPLMTSGTPHFKGNRDLYEQQVNKFIVKPGALDIVWGGDSRYWRIGTNSEPVELLQVSWLEVSGSIELGKLKAGQHYALAFTVSMKPDAFGWADSPVYLMAKLGDKYNWKKADLSSLRAGDKVQVPKDNALRFIVPNSFAPGEKLQFGMYEIWKGRWKGGLVIHEVLIEPVASA